MPNGPRKDSLSCRSAPGFNVAALAALLDGRASGSPASVVSSPGWRVSLRPVACPSSSSSGTSAGCYLRAGPARNSSYAFAIPCARIAGCRRDRDDASDRSFKVDWFASKRGFNFRTTFDHLTQVGPACPRRCPANTAHPLSSSGLAVDSSP